MTEQQTAVAKREPIDIDFSQGIVPQSYSEAMQMAALLHKSGLAPKTLDTVEKVAVASFMCLELGRPIMTGIQDIGVINGKAGIYGDAALALIRASGKLEYIKETESGTPYTDDWTFRCEVKRKGSPVPRIGMWTWQDAKRAGVDDPKTRDGRPDNFSPWRRYTRRMMQFKARNFPIRDEFGDVLKGIRLAEDNYDTIDMYATSNGHYEVGDQPEQPQDVKGNTASDFEQYIDTFGIDKADVDRFVKATADANGMTEDQIKASAVDNKERFETALRKWHEQNNRPSQEAPDLFADLKAMRPNTSDQNRQAFRQKVRDNADEISAWDTAQREAIENKWQGTFQEDEPYERLPWEPEPEPEEPPGETVATTPPPEPPQENGKDWRADMEIANREKALIEKNKNKTYAELGVRGYEKFSDVPKDKLDGVLSEIEAEVLA